jgi:hypothetical protein
MTMTTPTMRTAICVGKGEVYETYRT